jgi:hypothetical protein
MASKRSVMLLPASVPAEEPAPKNRASSRLINPIALIERVSGIEELP